MFKAGVASKRIIKGLAYEIQRITINEPDEWIVVFAPASTADKTRKRYTELSAELYRRTRIKVEREAIFNLKDREPSMVTGKIGNPTGTFGIVESKISGKKVILIDDVYTRGVTFSQLADRLDKAGAELVHGLFVAKTTYPSGDEKNPEDPVFWMTRSKPIQLDDLEPYEYALFDKCDTFAWDCLQFTGCNCCFRGCN